jgi:ParB family chromosome partitioning protein
MATLHVSLNAQRSDAFTLDPENLTLVADPDHPLYDPRVHDEPDEALVRNIMAYGVIEPIIIRKNGDRVEVVAGRGRVKCALEANRRLTAEGKQPIRVPAILKRGQDAEMYGVLISENECRREDNPLHKAEKAQRLINMGKSVEEVAIAFGVKRQSVEAWLALGDVAPPVLDAVEKGEISATAASKLSGMDRESQVQTFEALKSEGGKVTVERVKQAAREGKAEQQEKQPRMRSRMDILQILNNASRAVDGSGHSEFRKCYFMGFHDALLSVLGYSREHATPYGSPSNGEFWPCANPPEDAPVQDDPTGENSPDEVDEDKKSCLSCENYLMPGRKALCDRCEHEGKRLEWKAREAMADA